MNYFARSAAGIALALLCPLTGSLAYADSDGPMPADAYSSSSVRKHQDLERADHPHWAIEIAGSPQTFGGQGLLSSHSTSESVGTSLQIEYQPGFIQPYGALGIGPILSAFPISKNEGITSNFFSVWSLGAEIRYQGRFTPQQFLVPSIGYEVDRMSYGFTTGQQGFATLSGPVLGLEFLLNSIDPSRGADFYEASGISHSYLVGEVRDLTGSDGVVNASGLSWFFGLRFEM